jgi:16S rRNA (adenine1518-N6/adenine1519-N6)-dimethyltransferase
VEISQVKALLRQFGLKAKKRLGQHFLVDEDVLDHILSAAELSSEDIVVEVGPGLGVLTEKLAERVAGVIAVELDFKLASILREVLASFSNIKIVPADILKITPRQLLEDNLATSELGKGYKVVANFPYYIASPILRHFLEASLKPSLMVVMVQKEVGEAIVATPGKMSLLTVATQFYSEPTIIAYVPAKSFYPPPKVDSVILRLNIYPKPLIEISDVTGFFDMVSHGFKLPRKQLRNSLAQSLGMSPKQVSLLLQNAGIEAKQRAETLSLEEWKKLWEVFAPFGK